MITMIAIIDYDMGNVGSIKNMLEHLSVDAIITGDHKTILSADQIIIPGVGSFDQGMHNLIERGLDQVIKTFALELKKPVLGICLGMQLLGHSSEEGKCPGLGLIDFVNLRFQQTNEIPLRIPHMGWNTVKLEKEDPLLKDIDHTYRFYFVHSYYAKCNHQENVLMSTVYGQRFTSSVHHENIYGVQFHPEKSHHFGMKILSNFSRISHVL